MFEERAFSRKIVPMVSSKFRRQALEYHLPVIDGRVCIHAVYSITAGTQ